MNENKASAGASSGSGKPAPLIGEATRQASYRSISRMTVASTSLARNTSSGAAAASSGSSGQIYRGFTSNVSKEAVATMNRTAGGDPSFSQFTQVKPIDSRVQTQSKPIIVSPAADNKCHPRDYPVPEFPIAKTSVQVKDPNGLDECLKRVCQSVGGTLKPAKGCVRAKLENGTEIKVCAYRDSRSGKVMLEFNRLDGCAFTFQRAFVKAKLDACEYLEGVDKTTLASELELIEKKLAFWYGNAGTDALAQLLVENTASKATAV